MPEGIREKVNLLTKLFTLLTRGVIEKIEG